MIAMRDEVLALLRGEAVAYDERDAPRYRCPTCCDGGTVRVWHEKTIDLVRKLIDAGREWIGNAGCYDAVAACGCSAGDDWHVRESKGVRRIFLPRYTPQTHCRLLTSISNPIDRERLLDWIATWKPQNYTDFGDYGGN